MTRIEQIADLRRQYQQAMDARKWKLATLIWVRMTLLMNRQLRAENRRAKRAA